MAHPDLATLQQLAREARVQILRRWRITAGRAPRVIPRP